jgi:hypothetical protein
MLSSSSAVADGHVSTQAAESEQPTEHTTPNIQLSRMAPRKLTKCLPKDPPSSS